MAHHRGWTRLAAPAAFLLAVTVAALLVRSALNEEGASPTAKKPGSATVTRRAYYTVKAGDTLGSIARRHGVTVAWLEKLNPRVSPTSLFIGQRLRVR